MKAKAFVARAEGVDAAKRLGDETIDRAKSATGKFSSRITERQRRGRAGVEKRNNGD